MISIPYPLIIAHRGYSGKYPENTLAAFQAAFDAHADMVELDITLTRDRKIVVIHDDRLERTTNGRGFVTDYAMEDLRKLDAGSWFNARFSSERLPELEEVIDLLKGKLLINIEIKSSAFEAHYPKDTIEQQTVELIRRKKMQDSVIISSFEWQFLERLRRIKGAPAISLLSDEDRGTTAVTECTRLSAFSWHQNKNTIDSFMIDRMHKANIKVFAYTVNSIKKFNQLIKMGVDGVFTNDPVMLRAHTGGL